MIETPIETYQLNGKTVYVKREDLSAGDPDAPTFSKIRGLEKRLKQLVEEGYQTIGYVETSISMAGWGICYLARNLPVKVIIFNPIYKPRNPLPLHQLLLQKHREKWNEHSNVSVIDIQATRVLLNFYKARTIMQEYPNPILLPLGLPLSETIEETARITKEIAHDYQTWVVNIGSGSICSGVVKGLKDNPQAKIYGIMGRTGSVAAKRKKIIAGTQELFYRPQLEVIDEGFEYTEPCEADAPFPCHPFYDLKAWKWLENNVDSLKGKIIFWNIGAMPWTIGK